MVMETSLRLGGRNSDGLRIHAKDKLLVSSNALLQAHAEIDTTTGTPTYLALLSRHFFPRLSANIGVGIHLPLLHNEDDDPFGYILRGKKASSFTSTGLLGINLKGRLLVDKHLNPRIATGALELAWTILDLRQDQDVRLKLGYHFQHKMPYFQLKETNWTLNGYMDGKWDVRFDI